MKGSTLFLSQLKIKESYMKNRYNVEQHPDHLSFNHLHSNFWPLFYSFMNLTRLYFLKMSSFKNQAIECPSLENCEYFPTFLSFSCHLYLSWQVTTVIFISHCIHHILSLLKPLQNFPIALCIEFFIHSIH